MKFTKTYKLLILICFPFLFYGQKDTLKVKRLAIYVSPSQVFFGDIPLGIEHRLTKKLAHEVYLQIKVTSPILNLYNYNKGFGVKYFFKYNLLNSKKTYLSVNLGYSYLNVSFENKQEISPLYTTLYNDVAPKYNTSLRKKANMIITGVSFEKKIVKHFYFGTNLFFEYGKVIMNYEINDPEFEKKLLIPISPYYYEKKQNIYNMNLIIKLGYEIY